MVADGEPLADGVRWTVFAERETDLMPVERRTGGATRFDLAPGTYYVHAGYGQASRTVRVIVDGDVEQTVSLGAGGLSLDATSGGALIPDRLLRFDVFERAGEGERRPIARDVPPERVVRLNAGTYHVLSRFGALDTHVRADLVVRPGRTTHAVMQHRGAEVRLRLASEIGGPPIAGTAWSVFTDQGEEVFASTLNAPAIVLPEGAYEAVVRNGSRTLRHAFTVEPGRARTVELLLP